MLAAFGGCSPVKSELLAVLPHGYSPAFLATCSLCSLLARQLLLRPLQGHCVGCWLALLPAGGASRALL